MNIDSLETDVRRILNLSGTYWNLWDESERYSAMEKEEEMHERAIQTVNSINSLLILSSMYICTFVYCAQCSAQIYHFCMVKIFFLFLYLCTNVLIYRLFIFLLYLFNSFKRTNSLCRLEK